MSEIAQNDGFKVTAPAVAGAYFPKLPFQWIGPITFAIELVAIIGASCVSGLLYWRYVLDEPGDIETFVAVGLAAFVYYAVVFLSRGNYSIGVLTSTGKQIREVSAVWALVCLCLMGLAFLFKIGPNFSRGGTLIFFALAWLLLIAWRCGVTQLIAAARAAGALVGRNVILIGDAQLLRRADWYEELNQHGYNVVKTFPVAEFRNELALDDVVAATRHDPYVEAVFLVLDWTQSDRIDGLTEQLSVIPLPLWLLPDLKVGRLLNKLPVQIGPLRAAELQRGPLTWGERAGKRVLDLFIAVPAAIALLPLMLSAALLVKWDSRGPMLFKQVRSGFNGRPFPILKFRTLTTHEDHNLLRPVCRNDTRLTRIGRLLRRTSIDELPQLFNIIRGEMSLVGPRPHPGPADSHYGQLIANYALRNHVKPGLTGWAQVNGFRGEPDVSRMKARVEFDLWYIDNWSFWLDLKIMVRTVFVLFRQPMAY